MKGFCIKLICSLIPFVIIFGIFLGFEQYDYFGLRGGHYRYMSKPISTMREMNRTHPENIMLGDSRVANLNVDYIEELTGERYEMMAFGGSTLNEQIDLFWYSVEHTDLKKVMIGLSFYSLNDNHYADRVTSVLPMVENPEKFITNLNCWIDAFYYFYVETNNTFFRLLGKEDNIIYIDDPQSLKQDTPIPDDYLRQDIIDYSRIIYDQCIDYSYGDYLERLDEICRYCDDNDIELTIVLYNSHRYIWENVIYALGIDSEMNYYKDFLKSRANVIDMEYYNNYSMDNSIFYDGFHMFLNEKKHLARVFFAGEECEYAVRTVKEEYLASRDAA